MLILIPSSGVSGTSGSKSGTSGRYNPSEFITMIYSRQFSSFFSLLPVLFLVLPVL